MTGDDVRTVFEPRLPQDEMDRLCQPCGVIKRPHKLHLGMLVQAMGLAAGTPGGAYQADVWRSSLAGAVPRVTRAAFCRGFDGPLAPGMAARAYAWAQLVAWPGSLSGVTDGSMGDAAVGTVRDAPIADGPGTGDDAARTVPTELSGGCGAPGRDHGSPAREHDSPPLQIDESWRGCGWLADLASASLARRRACEHDEGHFVIRRKDHWTPQVDHIAHGQVTRQFCPGTALDVLLAEHTLILDGQAMAAAGPVGGASIPLPVRLVGAQTPPGDGFFRTNLPPRVGPRQVADLERVRWEVERSMQLEQSVQRLDAIAAAYACSLKTRLQASLMASTITAVRAHRHHLKTCPQPGGAPRTEAPLPTRLLALPRTVSCQSIAQAVALTGAEAKRRGVRSRTCSRPQAKTPTGAVGRQ
jgi:hypothetical protein